MKKKKAGKLALNKETLRNLNREHLRTAVGGSAAESDCVSDCYACRTDLCTQYPVCEATGVRTCRCSLDAACCSTTEPITG